MASVTNETVGATVFTDASGYKGDNLNATQDTWAELMDGNAFGGLPYMTPLAITYNGVTHTYYKRDIGTGGGPINGYPRKVDLHVPNLHGITDSVVVQVGGAGAAAGASGSGTTSGGEPLTWTVPAGVSKQIVAPPPHTDQLAMITALQDPQLIRIQCLAVAEQILSGVARNKYRGPKVLDLSEAIIDIIIETSIQGASTLTVKVLDPAWQLLTLQDKNGNRFFDTDEAGWLLPVDIVDFPLGSNCSWRLVAIAPSTDLTAANLELTFEDRIVTKMREQMGPKQGTPNQKISDFIRQCYDQARGFKGDGIPPFRFIAQLNPPPTNPTNNPPASSKHSNAAPARQNWQKNPGNDAQAIANSIQQVINKVTSVFGGHVSLLNPQTFTNPFSDPFKGTPNPFK